VSLIRLHTEKIRPPRALWVPFELGRPFGRPGDAEFQARVLRAALSLLEVQAGPVLEDFPDDADGDPAEAAVVACPVRLRPRPAGTPDDALIDDVRREVAMLRVWYDLGVERRGRTTVGASPFDVDGSLELLAAVFRSEPPPSPVGGHSVGDAVRLSAGDMTAFYFEAVTAQPGPLPSSRRLEAWFWEETSCAILLRTLQSRLESIPGDELSEVWLLPAGVEEL
jgi:hypothetical protein